MIRLFGTELRRCFRSVSFLVALAATAGMGVIAAAVSFSTLYGVIPALAVSIVVSLQLTPEFVSGGLRNKIICGHKKGSVFFTQLLIGLVLSVLYTLAFCGGLALNMDGHTAEILPTDEILRFCCAVFSCTAVFAVLLVTVNMLLSNKTLAPILSFLLIVALLALGMYVEEQLRPEEFWIQYDLVEVNGQWIQQEIKVPNEAYVGGTLRTVYNTFQAVNPYSHAAGVFEVMQMYFNPYYSLEDLAEYTAPVQYQPLWSALMSLLVALVGFLVFRKKDIK